MGAANFDCSEPANVITNQYLAGITIKCILSYDSKFTELYLSQKWLANG